MKIRICTGFDRDAQKEIFETVSITAAEARDFIEDHMRRVDYDSAAAWAASRRKAAKKKPK